MRKTPRMLCVLAIGGLAWMAAAHFARGEAVCLSGVPAYNWYHGCGPTAAASIIGYYDLKGYDNLFQASGWDAVKLTANVQDEISSPAHNAKYDPTPDNPALPVPEMTSIACWFGTSVDPVPYGGSYQSWACGMFEAYAASRGYDCISTQDYYGIFGWEDLVAEIDAGRPMMFLVDFTGDGECDHFVPVFGYDDRGAAGRYYACYTTWSENEDVVWKQLRWLSSSYSWGVGVATYVQIVPEPSSLAMLAAAAVGMLFFAKRRPLH